MGLRDRAILETMYSAGLRVSEVVGLDDGDLDFDAGVLRVRGKGRRERLAPVGSYATRVLRDWLRSAGWQRSSVPAQRGSAADAAPGSRLKPDYDQQPAPVFVNSFGRRLTTRSVGADAGKVPEADRAGQPHHARIRCGTASPRICWTAGPTSAACRNYLGHKSLVTTQIYTHVSTAALRKCTSGRTRGRNSVGSGD